MFQKIKWLKMRNKTIYDVIIIGSGIAGLNLSNILPKDKKVLIVTKERSWDCNTFYAQGGIAVAVDEDDIKAHIKDTLDAGAGLCDEKAVRVMCSDGIGVVKDLMDRGCPFDKDENGNILYTKEAAHSKNRIIHAGGDATGREVHKFLMFENPHELLYNTTVTDLLIENDICYGVKVYNCGKIRNYYAKTVVIASGGVGSIYEYHTNSYTISGELQGIALEKGLRLRDMEMMQFHPTVFIHSVGARKQLLTEALRGEGAWIVDEDGKRFLFEYDDRGELSPRSVVSRAIFEYKAKTKKEVFLDLGMFDKEFFKKRFPTIYYNLKDLGYNLPESKVPISPAFHYSMGGIEVDLDGKVKGMKNLYAIGEVANTRVHGANRLASNSLLEGLVFSKRAKESILKDSFEFDIKEFSEEEEELFKPSDKKIKNELRRLMWESAGVVRSRKKLEDTLLKIDGFLGLDIGKFLRLRLKTSRKIVKSTICKEESIGVHYIVD
jgi:L-aspartate oxidase